MTKSLNDHAVILNPSGSHRASIIWLHGLGADGHDFENIVPELGLSEDLGIRFIFPHAPERPVTINGGMVMRAWYDIKDPDLSKQPDKVDFEASASTIGNWIDREIEAGISANQIILAGFSQGGAISLHCGLFYPEQLAGLMILSSYLPFPDVMEQGSASANRETPILMMHGEFDPVIPVSFARQSCKLLMGQQYAVEWHDYPMQHGLCPEQIEHLSFWISTILQNG